LEEAVDLSYDRFLMNECYEVINKGFCNPIFMNLAPIKANLGLQYICQYSNQAADWMASEQRMDSWRNLGAASFS
jgi:hypothetical protein